MLEGNGPFTATQIREHTEEYWAIENRKFNEYYYNTFTKPMLERVAEILIRHGHMKQEEWDAVANDSNTVSQG